MKIYKKIFLLSAAFLFLLKPVLVLTENPQPDKYGASKVYNNSLLSLLGVGRAENPLDIIQGVVQLILGFVGIVLFGLILYAGFIWIKARDNTNEVEKAKNIIENSLYGIIIIVLAYGISEFIFSRLIGG